VVLHARTGGWVIPHFKHTPDGSCEYGKGETPEHRAVKALLRDHYRVRGYDVKVEYGLANRRADIFVSELRVAFEVEFSQRETAPFVAKCRDYLRLGVRSLWILRQRRISAQSVQAGKTVVVSTPPVLRFMHTKHCPRGASYAFLYMIKVGW
jgi:competence CoiA-like predicted nuclease